MTPGWAHDPAVLARVALGVIGLGVVTFALLLFVTAPYGRHARGGWGPTIPSRLVWVVMESPSVLVFAAAFFTGPAASLPVHFVFFALWMLHYVHRTYVFPFRIRAGGKRTPVVVGFLALLFTSVNGWMNGAWVGGVGPYAQGWFADPRCVAGVALFLLGWGINLHADTVLIRLRAPGETGYKIPVGGLYRYVTCPNYFGEILEWAGWAIATWSLPGLAFALYTVANLAPRALTHHAWYREEFPDYPPERKALVPFVV